MIVAGWSRWMGFGFVHGGERERERRGRKREKIRDRRLFFWLYILVDNIYYFNE